MHARMCVSGVRGPVRKDTSQAPVRSIARRSPTATHDSAMRAGLMALILHSGRAGSSAPNEHF